MKVYVCYSASDNIDEGDAEGIWLFGPVFNNEQAAKDFVHTERTGDVNSRAYPTYAKEVGYIGYTEMEVEPTTKAYYKGLRERFDSMFPTG